MLIVFHVSAFVNGFILVLVANVPEGMVSKHGCIKTYLVSNNEYWLSLRNLGLPATVMSCLTITAQRLRDRNVLIKRSDIVENLGAATVCAKHSSCLFSLFLILNAHFHDTTLYIVTMAIFLCSWLEVENTL